MYSAIVKRNVHSCTGRVGVAHNSSIFFFFVSSKSSFYLFVGKCFAVHQSPIISDSFLSIFL